MSKEKITLNVEGMSCIHCVNAVKNAIGSLSGISQVDVDLEEKKATADYDPEKVSVQSIKDAIEDQGYDVV